MPRGMTTRSRLIALVVTAAALPAANAHAMPIPEGPGAGELPQFSGSPATARPLSAMEPPRHPFMAPNGLSNLHVDAWQTDRNRWFGPLGRGIGRTSTFQASDCASVTFDAAGRIVTTCVGLQGPRLMMFNPRTLEQLATLPLPPRQLQASGDPNPFTNFSGGGYFYLDQRDRVVIPTTTRHVYVIRETPGPGFAIERDYDLTSAVAPTDAIISALPDWAGRIWFASVAGVVGTIDPASGAVKFVALGEGNGNSFTIDETGGVYIVSNAALYRFDAAPDGTPTISWRETYENIGQKKPGQTQAGSGTTPTIHAGRYVSITDNADPMNVLVYRRDRGAVAGRLICKQPVFAKGQSATDNSLIGTDNSIVVENNYGYTGPAATENGRTTTPGVERVDFDAGGGCHKVWHSNEISPTVVPKLSLSSGLVYVYAKPPRADGQDAWYLTAIDFRTGKTVYRRLSGEGLGFNNNYAPITLARDGTAFVGTLGGLVRLADAVPPSFGSASPRVRLRIALSYRRGRTRAGKRCARGAIRARLRGADVGQVKRAEFRVGRRRVARDGKKPFAKRIAARRFRGHRSHVYRVGARARLDDRRLVKRSKRVRVCAARAGQTRGRAPRFTG
jgi:hypothetical protein